MFPAGWLAASIKLMCGTAVHTEGYDFQTGPAILFANHGSHLDFLVLWASLPESVRRRTRPVAAADYWLQGALRRFFSASVFNAVLIDRSGRDGSDPIELMGDAIDSGCWLILFPEGTRSESGELGAFKTGIFHLATQYPHIPLVPVALRNLNRVLPKGEVVPIPLMTRAVIGEGLYLREGEVKDDFLRRARDALLELDR